MSESRSRSAVKAISWRVLAFIITFIFLRIVTKDTALSISTSIFINLTKTLIYFCHERIWNLIKWGRDNE